ncbi:MAG: cytochrome c3 family protein [Candidatus Methylomirabilia bacterium]
MIRIPALCAAGLTLAATLFAAAASGGELKVLAPPDGARLAGSRVTLIGSGSAGDLQVTLNGRKLAGIKQVGRAFTGPLELVEGKNVLLVRSGAESRQSTFEYRVKDTGGAYRYHDPVSDGECKSCHPQGVGRTSPVTEARLCSACHDPKTGFKRLHGPLGAGQCTICHDPHGSASPALLVMGVRALCVQCHAQGQSQTHIEKSGSKQCPECHDPHGSEKQFLLK